jgi:diguanylate cyclase (GGDEF)-like protein
LKLLANKVAVFFIFFLVLNPLFSEKLFLEKNTNDVSEDIDMYYFVDEKLEYNWNTITNEENKLPYIKVNRTSLNLGHLDKPVWIKIPYSASSDALSYIMKIGFPSLEEIEIKFQNTKDDWRSKKGGRLYSHRKWEFDNRNVLFKLDDLKTEGNFYLKIRTRTGLMIPISFFTEYHFHRNDSTLISFEFTFIGLLLGMAIYNAFLWLMIKERAYIYYSCYITSILFYISTMNGIAYQYLWPNHITWNIYSGTLIITSAAFFGTLFTVNFLDAKGRSKRLRVAKYIIFCFWAFISLCFFILPFNLYLKYLTLGVVITAIALLSIGVIAVIKGFAPARLYLFSWGIALSAISYYALFLLGYFPGQQYSHQIVKIGVGLESMLLSIALASKVNQIQLEKDKNFRKFKDKANKINLLKDEFLANTSHEIKTPLHGIIGITESLLEDNIGPLPKHVRDNIKIIHRSGKRLSILINDILDITRLKHKDITLNIQKIDPYQVVSQVITLLNPVSFKPNLIIRNHIPPEGPYVLCDENRLHQILFNMISNAIKFTDSGYIDISEQIFGDKLKFSIKDTGTGIEKNNLTRIFSRFDQLEISDRLKYQGSGLGLPIAKKLIELHSGTIEVFSVPGEGTTFSFTLPFSNRSDSLIAEKEMPGEEQKSELSSIPSTRLIEKVDCPNPSEQKQLLVVDDEEINLHIIKNFLSKNNCQIEIARDGREALEKCSQKKFDLILLDVMMPLKSGYEVCRELRQKYSLTELPIILLTARNQPADYAMGLSAGANDFLSKPFDKSELFARIQNLLELDTAKKDIDSKEILLKEARYLANTDELTGLRNRRSFFNSAKLEWESSLVRTESICLLMMDIDHFKSLNDNYGHEVGDLFLKKVAEVLHFSVREKDIVARFGGEEFIILLSNTDFDTGILIAERIRKGIDSIEILIENHPPIKRTISIGISHNKDGIESFEKLIKNADELLYMAKKKGRNKIQFLSYV